MDIKKLLSSWHIWVIVVAIAGVFLFFGKDNLPGILPFALILLCPIMMLFMMSGKHKH